MELLDHSASIFIVVCNLFISSINDFYLFSPCFQRKTILSIYLYQTKALYSKSSILSSSRSAIKIILYGFANLVLIAVPCFCLRAFIMWYVGYNPTTSIVHKTVRSGNFGTNRNFLRNSSVSWSSYARPVKFNQTLWDIRQWFTSCEWGYILAISPRLTSGKPS